MDLEKEIKELKSKIDALEKSSKSRNVLFGSSYSNSGSTSSDYLIKTRGKVKIQIGNKFIDLVKDGKLNVESEFIFNKNEVGSKDGLYVIDNGNKVVLVSKGTQIDLLGEMGSTYVSFLGEQTTTSDQKEQALKNIGFMYDTIDDYTGINNGIIYVESMHKLYIVQNGEFTEYSVQIPNPYTGQFIISKSDDAKGAVVIKGTGDTNSLKFNTLEIYSTQNFSTYINSNSEMTFAIDGSDIISMTESDTKINNILTIKQLKMDNSPTFSLTTKNQKSTLMVDNLVVRNATNELPTGTIVMFNGEITNIPDGWHICDGEEGTPNLINHFIKAGNVVGTTGGSSEIQILEENLPSHTHTFEQTSVVTDSASIQAKIGKTNNTGDYACYLQDSSSEEGTHTHNLNLSEITLSSVGTGTPISYEPTYYTLIFIMKII